MIAFLEKGADRLEVEMEDLAGRGQQEDLVRARLLLATLGVERYGIQVKALAATLGKHQVTGSGLGEARDSVVPRRSRFSRQV